MSGRLQQCTKGIAVSLTMLGCAVCIKTSSYHHHEPSILNNVVDKLFPEKDVLV